jgi:thiamine kinase-like enzyme
MTLPPDLQPPDCQPDDLQSDDLRTALQTIPVLAVAPLSSWRIDRLAGVTNRNYRLRHAAAAGADTDDKGGDDFVLRLPGAGTSSYLNRVAGIHNAKLAARIGIAPAVIFADADRGWQLSRYLPDCRSLTSTDLHDPILRQAVGGLLGQLQRQGGAFQHEMRPFVIADRYLELAPHLRLLRLRQQAVAIEREIEAAPGAQVPAHIDPNPTNFLLDADHRLHLIDWEFSAMADPCWDLAAVALEGTFDAAAIADLLQAAGHPADQAMRRRIDLFQCALCLVASSWAYVEIAAGNQDSSLRDFADQRCESFAARLRELSR